VIDGNRLFCRIAASLILFLSPLAAAHSQTQPSPPKSVQTIDVFGTVTAQGADRTPALPLTIGDSLVPGTTIRTGAASAVLLRFTSGAVLRIGQRSVVLLSPSTAPRTVKLLAGQVVVRISDHSQVTLATPTLTIHGKSESLFAVSYELETARSIVSTSAGKIIVSPTATGRPSAVSAGRFLTYQRPSPPHIAPHNYEQTAVWRLLQTEPWTQSDRSGKTPAMNRHSEDQLQKYLHSIRVIPEQSIPFALSHILWQLHTEYTEKRADKWFKDPQQGRSRFPTQ